MPRTRIDDARVSAAVAGGDVRIAMPGLEDDHRASRRGS
jgi:hypothetical protein